MGMENIEHVVVVMFENRSFDNLLGWLYDNETNPPKINIPAQEQPTFNGLNQNTFFNLIDATSTEKIFASRPPSSWASCPNCNQAPTPDPHEEFEYVTFQLFGTSTPAPDAKADMSGFLQNYATTAAGAASANQIMQGYGPDEANVINDIARNFAVCDAWFAPVPSQTWPNRGFVHSGSSDGHVNNDLINFYTNQTIFNVLQAQNKSWRVFYNSLVTSLTFFQFSTVRIFRDSNFHRYSDFEDRCQTAADASPDDKLPAYSFIEPRFSPELLSQPEDYHPPHNICRGEQFLAQVYAAVSGCAYRDKIMLVILFDEHGGCYDHVSPPTGAPPPAPGPVATDGKTTFGFDRYGVRVPAIVVSSYVEPGTVFRASEGEQPYDHTSILATLRDWLNLDSDPANFLPSPRIASAPTLDRVLTRVKGNENTAWPQITAKCTIDGKDVSPDIPLNDVQKSMVAATLMETKGVQPNVAIGQAKQLQTYAHAASALELKPGEHEY